MVLQRLLHKCCHHVLHDLGLQPFPIPAVSPPSLVEPECSSCRFLHFKPPPLSTAPLRARAGPHPSTFAGPSPCPLFLSGATPTSQPQAPCASSSLTVSCELRLPELRGSFSVSQVTSVHRRGSNNTDPPKRKDWGSQSNRTFCDEGKVLYLCYSIW